jgi:hypothetical protein
MGQNRQQSSSSTRSLFGSFLVLYFFFGSPKRRRKFHLHSALFVRWNSGSRGSEKFFFAAMRGEENGATIRSRECLFSFSPPLWRFGCFSPFLLLAVEAKINKSVPHESKIHTEKMFLLRSIFDVSGTICIRIFNLLLFRAPPYALMRVEAAGGSGISSSDPQHARIFSRE